MFLMPDENTNESNAKGEEGDKPNEGDNKPISLYDKTEAIVTRQEEANKKTEELLARQETLHANQRLAGNTGGNVPTKPVSPEQAKTKQASDFFKDTALGEAIDKTNG